MIKLKQLNKNYYLGAAFLLVSSLLYYPLVSSPKIPLRDALIQFFLPISTVTGLRLAFFGIFLSGFMLLAFYFNNAGKKKLKSWAYLAILPVLSFVFLLLVVPRASRILFDEQIYQNIAQNILHTGKAQMCDHGDAELGEYRCFNTEYNKQPNGHPAYQSIFFSLFGVSENSAHLATEMGYLLTGLGALLFLYLMTESAWVALSGTFLLAMNPVYLSWARTTASEPTAVLFMVWSLVGAALYTKEKNVWALVLSLSAAVVASQVRTEGVIFLGVIGLFYILFTKEFYKDKNLFWGALFLALFSSVALLHIYAFRDNAWGSPAERFSWKYLGSNFQTNSAYFYTNAKFPILFTLASLLGIFSGPLKSFKLRGFLLVSFLVNWAVFLGFYAGSYEYGADIRYSLVSAPFVALLGGIGVGFLKLQLDKVMKQPMSSALMATTTLMALLSFFPKVRAVGEEGRPARACVDYSREIAGQVPKNSLVLAHNPCVWLMRGYNSALPQTVSANPASLKDLSKRYSGGVYFYKNFWCNTDDVSRAYCKELAEKFETQTLSEATPYGIKLGLYRLFPKKTITAPQRAVSSTK